MKWKAIFLLCLLLMTSISCGQKNNDHVAMQAPQDIKQAAGQEAATTGPYILGVGDELTITVFNNSDLQENVRIDPGGMIYPALTGEIRAEGLTISELVEIVKKKSSSLLKNPRIGIRLSTLRSQKVHIMGEVANPGTVTIDSRMRPLEAIARSGGFTQDANKERVILLRREKNVVKTIALDMTMFGLPGKGTPEQIYLQGNDIIFVSPSTIASISRFMTYFSNIISPLLSLQQGTVLWPDFIDVLEGTTDEKSTVIITP